MDWGKLLGFAAPLVGGMLSGGSKGMEQDRARQNSDSVLRDRTALDAIGERERALEERRKLEMLERELSNKTKADGYGQTINAQYMQAWKPATRPSRIPGGGSEGFMPSQASKDFAAQYEQDAMARALKGESFDALPAQEKFTPTPVKQPSLWERITGIAGLGLSAAGALKKQMDVAGMGEEDGGL